MEAEEEKEDYEEGDRDEETPRGAQVEGVRVGMDVPPPWSKTRTCLTLHPKVRTCCCRKSMENTRIITLGCTWTGELQTKL